MKIAVVLEGEAVTMEFKCRICGVADWRHCYAKHASFEVSERMGLNAAVMVDCPCSQCKKPVYELSHYA